MKKLVVALAAVLACTGGVLAADIKDRMEFPASQGTVVFYHNNHINEVKGNCTACHEKAPGKIEGFGKEFAHKLCIGCHEPHDGMPEGPTKCNGCHTK
jgi:predicted CXXCH cytochrome family protein